MSSNCFVIVTSIFSVVTLINAVPIATNVTNVLIADVSNLTSVPDPVNINGSLTILDATMAPIDLTTISSGPLVNGNESRDGRSAEDELIIPAQDNLVKNESKETSTDKSSASRFPRDDDIDSGNSTISKSSVDETATNSPIAEVIPDSNSTLIEGIIESSSSSSVSSVSSSSSTIVDLSTPSSSSSSPPSTTTTSTIKPITDKVIGDATTSDTPRIGRSQSDTIEDEINSNLNDTLLALTTLSSILNQANANDSLSSV